MAQCDERDVLFCSMAEDKTDMVVITAEPISQEKVIDFVTNPTAGGIALFIG